MLSGCAAVLCSLVGKWRAVPCQQPVPPWRLCMPPANLRLAYAPRRFGPAHSGDAGGSDEEPEVVPPLPPLRRSRPPAQQAGEARQRDADASPTTSGSHRSGSGAGSASGSQASGGGLPRATLPQPILSVRQAQQAAAVQDLPGIGTWAGRYRLFGRDAPPTGQQAADAQQAAAQAAAAEQGQQQSDSARKREAEEARDYFGSPVVLRAGGFDQPGPTGLRSGGGSYGSEQAREDAWRWRFSRCGRLAGGAADAHKRRAACQQHAVGPRPRASTCAACTASRTECATQQPAVPPVLTTTVLCSLLSCLAGSGPLSRRSFTRRVTPARWLQMTSTRLPSLRCERSAWRIYWGLRR